MIPWVSGQVRLDCLRPQGTTLHDSITYKCVSPYKMIQKLETVKLFTDCGITENSLQFEIIVY